MGVVQMLEGHPAVARSRPQFQTDATVADTPRPLWRRHERVPLSGSWKHCLGESCARCRTAMAVDDRRFCGTLVFGQRFSIPLS